MTWTVWLAVVAVLLLLVLAALHDRRARARGHVLRRDATGAIRRRRRAVRDARARDLLDRNLQNGFRG